MIVVADASPLILLGKIRKLDLLFRLFGNDMRIPQAVVREVLTPNTEPSERRVLEDFINAVQVVEVTRPRAFARAMSAADNAVLTLAVREKTDIVLCDERITRTMAEAEGRRPIGTMGVLLRAMRKQIVSRSETRQDVDRLINTYRFRIGIEVYQAILAEIERIRG